MKEINRHKTFISFRNPEGKRIKEELLELNDKYQIFDDYSIGKGDIDRSDFKDDEAIRKEIIDGWISGATVTILIVTEKMWESKFIDWEMQATMSSNINNEKMGLLIIYSDEIDSKNISAYHENQEEAEVVKEIVGKDKDWRKIDWDADEKKFSDLPKRVIKNLKKDDVKIDIINWREIIKNGDYSAAQNIKKLIDAAFKERKNNKYDISDKLQRNHK